MRLRASDGSPYERDRNNFRQSLFSEQLNVLTKEGLKTGRKKASQYMKGANLKGENHRNTDFSGCNLRGANLSEADLRNSDFTNADLSGADLSGRLTS